LTEIVDATITLVNNPAAVAGILKFVQGPDFPTAGIFTAARDLWATARAARFMMRARAAIENVTRTSKRHRTRFVSSDKARLIERIATVNQKTIDDISDIRDESDATGCAS